MRINVTDKTNKEIKKIIQDLKLKQKSKEIWLEKTKNKVNLRWRI